MMWKRFVSSSGTHFDLEDEKGRLLARVEKSGRVWMVHVRPRDHRGRQRTVFFFGMDTSAVRAIAHANRELAAHEKALRRKAGIPEPEDRAPFGVLAIPDAFRSRS